MTNKGKISVLMVYYSFSGQTSGLLHALAHGLREEGIIVKLEKLRPVTPLRFPVGSFFRTFRMMLTTLFRVRVPIRPPGEPAFAPHNLIILAGPTWSYNPSGPILAFLDRYGREILAGQQVIPLISCRGYWRIHCRGLIKKLSRCGAGVRGSIVFSHPAREPWRTLGVFLKIVGKAPERSRFFGRYYKRFGHSKDQINEAEKFGRLIAKALKEDKPLSEINFRSQVSLP